MTRSKISVALILSAAVGVLTAMPAHAGTRHTHKPSIPASARNSVDPGPLRSTQKGDWENRSPFYRGPTYIGRY